MEEDFQEKVGQKQDKNFTGTARMFVLFTLVSFLVGGVGGFLGSQWQAQVSKEQGVKVENNSIESSVTVREESGVIDVVKKASPAVVSIVGSKTSGSGSVGGFELDPFYQFFGLPRPRRGAPNEPVTRQVSAGSGFFVSKDGIILTNKHVVDETDAKYSVVTSDKRTLEAKVLAKDPVSDLAILKVEIEDTPTLELSDSSKIEIGQRVVAIGYSLGQYQNTVTSGIVSGIGRSIVAGSLGGESEQLEGVIQTDAAINPGNSGGPLLNLAGQVVGINTAMDSQGQLIGFAIPSGDAKMALESFQKTGKIQRSYLGVRYVLITQDLAEDRGLPRDRGALIIPGEMREDFAVQPNSPADKAGLVENDIILEVNGKEITEDVSLIGLLRQISPGEQARLKIYHKGEEKEVTVTLGER